ncbi:MAG: glycosyltransferase family 9 protein [Casimicrobiaceae bacterium]
MFPARAPVAGHPLAPALVVRVRNFVGDVVLTLPALERLAAQGLELRLVGKGWLRLLFEAYPWPTHAYPGRLGDRLALLRSLRGPNPSRAIDALTFATSFSSAFEMRLAGLRPFGFRTEGRRPFLAASTPIVHGEHALASYWRLTSALLGDATSAPEAARLRLSARAEEVAHARRAALGIGAGYIVLVPFAGGTFEKLDKRWPYFDRLLPALLATGRDVIIAPGPGEEEEARARFGRAHLMTGLDLGAYTALMRDAALTIANDTGPGHMTAAAGGRLLSVLGPTKIEQWGARGPRVRIIQSWPEWPSVERVLEEAMALLSEP